MSDGLGRHWIAPRPTPIWVKPHLAAISATLSRAGPPKYGALGRTGHFRRAHLLWSGQQLSDLAGFKHFADYIAATHEPAFDIKLRDRGPIREHLRRSAASRRPAPPAATAKSAPSCWPNSTAGNGPGYGRKKLSCRTVSCICGPRTPPRSWTGGVARRRRELSRRSPRRRARRAGPDIPQVL